jgi:dolichyl-phosphooligosaccharide-protein glycotransferase
MQLKDFIGKYRSLLVPGLVLLIYLIAFALRAIPSLFTPSGGFLPTYDSDTWYTLRQVEVMVHSFPQYNWFDAMTAYPVGKVIGWGPLYPFIAALLPLFTGAATRVAVVNTAMWAGPLLGACMVPAMYLLGKAFAGRRAGLLAAALAVFVSFRLFFMGGYGIADHHIAEALLASLFILAYVTALAFLRDHPARLSSRGSLLLPVALSLLCGAVYFAGLLASTTLVILLLVAGIYTAVQIPADSLGGRPTHDYAILNSCLAASAILLLVLTFGMGAGDLSLSTYSAGQVLALAGFAGGTLVLVVLSYATRGNRLLFLVSYTALAGAALLAVLLIPPLRGIGDQLLQFFSLEGAYTVSIQEMHPWSIGLAWQNFNLFLLLGAGGLAFLALRMRKRWRREDILLGTWALSLLAITLLHGRFEYYLAAPLTLLSALCVVEAVERGLPGILQGALWRPGGPVSPKGRGDSPPAGGAGTRRKGKKKPKSVEKTPEKGTAGSRYPAIAAAVVLAALVAGSGISLWVDIQSGLQVPYREIPPDWLETLSWMEAGTPPPGVDYFGKYDPEDFSYPPGSYGVMATWDAGHWITFFARRIPNVNPFQDNLQWENGGAAFLLSQTEEKAARILDGLGTRFVITEIWTATDSFTAQIPWVDPTVNITPYMSGFLRPGADDPARLSFVEFYDDAYYQSMLVRLQVFDGSLVVPGSLSYIEYTLRQVPAPGETSPVQGFAAVITRIEDRDAADAVRDAEAMNANRPGKVYAAALSDRPDRPTVKVPAATRFRLVHESPTNVTLDPGTYRPVTTDIKHAKVFEYVKGAHIRGTGLIELPLVTNTGREFTYRQESSNGEFVVPYSTRGNPYDVKATGPYRIAGSGATYEVSEEDVLSGSTVG